MNDFENKPSGVGAGNSGPNESLQLQLTLQLLALVLMAATLGFFFYVQARRAKYDLSVIKPPATSIIQAFEQEKPGVDSFIAKVAEYGRTHPDFAPIMQKYQIPTNAAPAPAAAKPAATVAPKPAAPAPAPKK